MPKWAKRLITAIKAGTTVGTIVASTKYPAETELARLFFVKLKEVRERRETKD